MSLDIYLRLSEAPVEAVGVAEGHIFVREGGQNKEITREEWDKRYPGIEPVQFIGEADTREVFSANITHNLNRMAEACFLYGPMWNPEESGYTHARDLIAPLRYGLTKLVTDPVRLQEEFSPENGWGDYNLLLQTAVDYLEACLRYPDAEVSVWK